MPTLEYIQFSSEKLVFNNLSSEWMPETKNKLTNSLPQIFWSNGESWKEANLWALYQARSNKNIKTISSNMQGLLTYAKWLESESINWWHFPQRAYDRCLNRYRGELIVTRNRGELAPSTVSNRMSVAIRFYRWVFHQGLLTLYNPMWKDSTACVKIYDIAGFQRTITVNTTDLSIPNRKLAGALQLEGGLMPVTLAQRDEILSFSHDHSSKEFVLMLRLGFNTGMRLGTICDLKEETILDATPAPIPSFYQLSVGPCANPSVNTKKGISGRVLIPEPLLKEIQKYLWSHRRLLRKGKSKSIHSQLVFLNSKGKPYENVQGNHSSINTEMTRLRKLADKEGVESFIEFKFHRSRATFATLLMTAALEVFPDVSSAIRFVRDACLHKNDATTLDYIKFIEDTNAMKEAAAEFSAFFMGIKNNE